jgi:hypothetical protein
MGWGQSIYGDIPKYDLEGACSKLNRALKDLSDFGVMAEVCRMWQEARLWELAQQGRAEEKELREMHASDATIPRVLRGKEVIKSIMLL